MNRVDVSFSLLMFASLVVAINPCLGATPVKQGSIGEVERVIKLFFRSAGDRDPDTFLPLLTDSLVTIEGGAKEARSEILDTRKDLPALLTKGRWRSLSIAEVKVQVAPAMPSVAIVDFTLTVHLTEEQVSISTNALHYVHPEDYETRAKIEREIKERAHHMPGHAILIRNPNGWRIVVVALPQ